MSHVRLWLFRERGWASNERRRGDLNVLGGKHLFMFSPWCIISKGSVHVPSWVSHLSPIGNTLQRTLHGENVKPTVMSCIRQGENYMMLFKKKNERISYAFNKGDINSFGFT